MWTTSLRTTTQTYKIITAAAISDDPAFNGKNPVDVELVNIDNETAGITVVPRGGLSTSENGGQDTFTVVLNSEPKSDVTVALTSSNTTEGTVSPESLVFTPLNWMAPQLVTVTGVDDGDVKDPKHAYKINVSATSEDQNYNRFTMITVDVMNEDNESAGLTVALVSGIDPIDSTKLRTSENLDSATFTVALNSPPMGDVTIPVVSDATGEGTVSPESLTFTPLNWNAPQIVTVTGVDDDGTADGDQPYTIVLGPSTGDDSDYNAEPATNVPVSNADNDKPGFNLMLLSGVDPQDSRQAAHERIWHDCHLLAGPQFATLRSGDHHRCQQHALGSARSRPRRSRSRRTTGSRHRSSASRAAPTVSRMAARSFR